MTLIEFKQTLQDPSPPAAHALVIAMWQTARGNWDAAHEIAQSHEGESNYDWLHAHLHRVEGDEWNAGYWYRRAGKSFPEMNLEDEFEVLLQSFIVLV